MHVQLIQRGIGSRTWDVSHDGETYYLVVRDSDGWRLLPWSIHATHLDVSRSDVRGLMSGDLLLGEGYEEYDWRNDEG